MTDSAVRMDRLYRHQRHVYDLTRKYYLPGRDRLIEGLDPPPGGRVLEVGCGTARNLIVAARAWPRARLYGIDVSQEMLATARDKLRRSGLAPRIALAAADATRFDPALLFGVPGFARIVFSYSLSMIPDWPAALAAALRRLPAGGEIHIVDFGRQEGLAPWFRTSLRLWLGRFQVEPRDGIEGELRRLAQGGGQVVRLERLFGGYAQYAVFRRTSAHGAPVPAALATS